MTLSSKIITVLAATLALLLGALWIGYAPWAVHQQSIGEARATITYNAAIDKQKKQAGELLATETRKTTAATQALTEFKTAQEIQDAKNQTTVTGLQSRLRAAAGAAGRLRDPNAAGCGGSGGSAQGADPASASHRAADDAQAGGLFSAGATELLQRLTLESDAINNAYASCRPDALNLREALK